MDTKLKKDIQDFVTYMLNDYDEHASSGISKNILLHLIDAKFAVSLTYDELDEVLLEIDVISGIYKDSNSELKSNVSYHYRYAHIVNLVDRENIPLTICDDEVIESERYKVMNSIYTIYRKIESEYRKMEKVDVNDIDKGYHKNNINSYYNDIQHLRVNYNVTKIDEFKKYYGDPENEWWDILKID